MAPWRNLRPRASPSWALGLSLCVAIFFAVAAFLLNGLPPYVWIQLTTETISYRVARPAQAGIAFDEGIIAGFDCPEAYDGATFRGLIEPVQGAIVQYRISGRGISIEFTGPGPLGVLSTDEDFECPLPSEKFKLEVPRTALAIKWPLPIMGPAVAGRELQGMTAPGRGSDRPATLLVDGTVRLFGRTSLPWGSPSLFPLKDAEFSIPAGSRLTSGDDISDPERAGDSWYGLAIPDLDERNFKVSATTDSRSLILFRPGPGTQKEIFTTSIFTRIFNDPSLAVLSFGLFVFIVAFQMVTAWLGLWREREKTG